MRETQALKSKGLRLGTDARLQLKRRETQALKSKGLRPQEGRHASRAEHCETQALKSKGLRRWLMSRFFS